jgi:FHS family glucose/mannose:H+ symporter-like MFS transporter
MSTRDLLANPSTRLILTVGFLSFVLLGAIQAMYGPAFPFFQSAYGVSARAVGLVMSLHFAGSVTAILLGGFLLERLGYGLIFTISASLVTVGCLGLALSPAWILTLLSALAVGLGYGGFAGSMNILFGQSFGARGATALNFLNGMFGIGAVLGPWLIKVFLPLGLTWPFLIAAGVGVAVVVLASRLSVPRGQGGAAVPEAGSGGVPWLLVLFLAMYFLYVGSETGAGGWLATHLTPFYGEAPATAFTAWFWVAFTLGRFLAAPLALVLKPSRLVMGAGVGSVLAFGVCHVPGLAPYGYILAGLFLAPIFPTGLAWLREVMPRRAVRASTLLIASASMGGVVFPPLVGLVVDLTSYALIPTALMAFALGCVMFALFLGYRTRQLRLVHSLRQPVAIDSSP